VIFDAYLSKIIRVVLFQILTSTFMAWAINMAQESSTGRKEGASKR